MHGAPVLGPEGAAEDDDFFGFDGTGNGYDNGNGLAGGRQGLTARQKLLLQQQQQQQARRLTYGQVGGVGGGLGAVGAGYGTLQRSDDYNLAHLGYGGHGGGHHIGHGHRPAYISGHSGGGYGHGHGHGGYGHKQPIVIKKRKKNADDEGLLYELFGDLNLDYETVALALGAIGTIAGIALFQVITAPGVRKKRDLDDEELAASPLDMTTNIFWRGK